MDTSRNRNSGAPLCTKTACDKTLPRCRILLGRSIYVVASDFKGEIYIHVRRYRKGGDKLIPTKDGIALTLRRWKELKDIVPQIQERVRAYDVEGEDVKFRHHLGGNRCASVTQGFPCVDIREFWMPEDADEIHATKRGVSLTFGEFENLIRHMVTIDNHVPELEHVIPCIMQRDHQNQLGLLRCPECNPSQYKDW